MTSTSLTLRASAKGGRLLMAAAAIASLSVPAVRLAASGETPVVTVREERGTYQVEARFRVDGPMSAAWMVLTDYERIPRFMPDVRSTVVLERSAGRAVIEQEAASRLWMFSKRIHLVLDIQEQRDTLLFRDRCGRSFERYEGAWRLSLEEGHTMITYELTAQPRFDVPAFLLKRLLRRDSGQMIERLRREIAARASR